MSLQKILNKVSQLEEAGFTYKEDWNESVRDMYGLDCISISNRWCYVKGVLQKDISTEELQKLYEHARSRYLTRKDENAKKLELTNEKAAEEYLSTETSLVDKNASKITKLVIRDIGEYVLQTGDTANLDTSDGYTPISVTISNGLKRSTYPIINIITIVYN